MYECLNEWDEHEQMDLGSELNVVYDESDDTVSFQQQYE